MALPGGCLGLCFRACSLKQCLHSTGEGRAAEICSGYFLAKCSQLLQLCWGALGGGGRISEPLAPQGPSLSLISKPGELANIQFRAPVITESESLEYLFFFFKSPALGNTDASQGFFISSLLQVSGAPQSNVFNRVAMNHGGFRKSPRRYPRPTKSESLGEGVKPRRRCAKENPS